MSSAPVPRRCTGTSAARTACWTWCLTRSSARAGPGAWETVGEGGPTRSARWREQLKDVARAQRRTSLRHPYLVRITIGRIPMGPNALRYSEHVLAILRAGGLSPRLAVQGYLLLIATVNGFTVDETGVEDGPAESAPRGDPAAVAEAANMARDYIASLPADMFPNMTALADRVRVLRTPTSASSCSSISSSTGWPAGRPRADQAAVAEYCQPARSVKNGRMPSPTRPGRTALSPEPRSPAAPSTSDPIPVDFNFRLDLGGPYPSPWWVPHDLVRVPFATAGISGRVGQR